MYCRFNCMGAYFQTLTSCATTRYFCGGLGSVNPKDVSRQGSSLPSFTWERFLHPRNFISRQSLLLAGMGSAMKLPPHVLSQVKLGNEEQALIEFLFQPFRHPLL